MKEMVSIPSNGQFNSYNTRFKVKIWRIVVSSPQTGQFNSYEIFFPFLTTNSLHKVSIPSNGSIQFLHMMIDIEARTGFLGCLIPQTGQFNSYSTS